LELLGLGRLRGSADERKPLRTLCDHAVMYDGPRIVDEVNPTHDEIRAWAVSGAVAPMEDWDIIIAEPMNLAVLLDLVSDQAVPGRRYLLGSMYCLIGHSDLADPRVLSAVAAAKESSDAWVATWGRRAQQVLADPSMFDRADWCGWPGLAANPSG
jgi:hypothetical protein